MTWERSHLVQLVSSTVNWFRIPSDLTIFASFSLVMPGLFRANSDHRSALSVRSLSGLLIYQAVLLHQRINCFPLLLSASPSDIFDVLSLI
jgi:hypothetical protein